MDSTSGNSLINGNRDDERADGRSVGLRERNEEAEARQSGIATDNTDNSAQLSRTWKRNERLVYLINFTHMTMFTMCLGGVFDIYLYNLSEQAVFLVPHTPASIGRESKSPYPLKHLDTYREFEMTFEVWPSADFAHSPDPHCNLTYTCAATLLHVTDGAGNGDCCRIGNRIPAMFLGNGNSVLYLAMDALGQPQTENIREYDEFHSCNSSHPLQTDRWSSIKVKHATGGSAKGEFSDKSDAPVVTMFVDSRKVCQINLAANGNLPERSKALVFLGALQGPEFHDAHVPANAKIRNLKYGKPASNLFVGAVMSTQGICSMFLMFPIGWLGDRYSRYRLLRISLCFGFAAAAMLAGAVLLSNIYLIFSGIVFFSAYQQSLSSLIYAVLADNVPKGDRAKASVNYKTLSALAMSFGPTIQLGVILLGPAEDDWRSGTFETLLLPGWCLMPVVAALVWSVTDVGKKCSALPNVDEAAAVNLSTVANTSAAVSSVASEASRERRARKQMHELWLDDPVVCKWRRRFVVAASAQAFFIGTLLANGMTVRYFSLYFTQILKFSPARLCLLNAVCRLWIAIFVQISRPLIKIVGRTNLCLVFHFLSAFATVGVYGAGIFEPSVWVACLSYMLRFSFLHARDPMLYSITMDIVPESQRSRWAALNSLRTLSFSGSALIGGILADSYGYQFSFTVTVISLLACTGLFLPAWFCFPKHEGASQVLDQSDSMDSPPPGQHRVRSWASILRIDSLGQGLRHSPV